MTPKTLTLLAILAFVALTLGSFVWFIVSWDPEQEQSVVLRPVQSGSPFKTGDA
jgi:hypothetical protein